MSKKNLKVFVVIERRADYSRYRPILQEMSKDSFFELYIVVTGICLLDIHGKDVNYIKNDGFKINAELEMFKNNHPDTGGEMIKSMSRIMSSLVEELEKATPDLVLSGFDIGANFGWYSLHFSKMVGNSGNVYAFEPIKETHDELKSNLSLNNIANVKTYEFALGNKEYETNFGIPFFDGGSAATSQNLSFSKKVKIPVFTLDKIFERENIKKINLIKADIEGGELNFLLGADKVLEKYKPNIFIEIIDMHCNRFGHKPFDVLNYLIKKNYQAFYIGNEYSDKKENYNMKDLIKPDLKNLPNGNYFFF